MSRSCINIGGNATQGTNIGTGIEVYAGKSGVNQLQFKTLSVTGTTMAITCDGNNIYFSAATGGGGSISGTPYRIPTFDSGGTALQDSNIQSTGYTMYAAACMVLETCASNCGLYLNPRETSGTNYVRLYIGRPENPTCVATQQILSTGQATNISLSLYPKGTGALRLNGSEVNIGSYGSGMDYFTSNHTLNLRGETTIQQIGGNASVTDACNFCICGGDGYSGGGCSGDGGNLNLYGGSASGTLNCDGGNLTLTAGVAQGSGVAGRIALCGLPSKTSETCGLYIDASGNLSTGLISGGSGGSGFTIANNGLCTNGTTTVGLGGTLANNTCINGNGEVYSLSLTGMSFMKLAGQSTVDIDGCNSSMTVGGGIWICGGGFTYMCNLPSGTQSNVAYVAADGRLYCGAAGGGGGLSATNNGLCDNGTTVGLGGTLANNTCINGNGEFYSLSLTGMSCMTLAGQSEICMMGCNSSMKVGGGVYVLGGGFTYLCNLPSGTQSNVAYVAADGRLYCGAAGGGGGLTASNNGLCDNGTTVSLGGNLTGDTSINTQGNQFWLRGCDISTRTEMQFIDATQQIHFYTKNSHFDDDYGFLAIEGSGVYMKQQHPTTSHTVRVNSEAAWLCGTNFIIDALSAATKSNVIYYDTTTCRLSYGAAGGGGGLSASNNGLCDNGTTVGLGGLLANATTISMTGTNSLKISGGINCLEVTTGKTLMISQSFPYLSTFCVASNKVQLMSIDIGAGGHLQYLETCSANDLIRLGSGNGGGTNSFFDVTFSGVTLCSNYASFAGLEYCSDYKSNYSARSLVDAAYVTGRTVIGWTCATNGSLALGVDTMIYQAGACNNIAIGTCAFAANSTSDGNVMIGHFAAKNTAATTACRNVAIGECSFMCGCGCFNVSVGSWAMEAEAGISSYNTAVGNGALREIGGGCCNVGVGTYALQGLSTGRHNTALGYYAGASITTQSGNTFVGHFAGGSETLSDKLYIANANSTFLIKGCFSNNTVCNAANSTAWSTTSDCRIKENVVTVPNAISKISALNPVLFDYTTGYSETQLWSNEQRTENYGFVAQEFETVFPKYVQESNDAICAGNMVSDFRTINTGHLVPILVKAIQELEARVQALESQ